MPFLDKPSACEGCPAQTKGRSFVSWTGPSNATIAFLGQGPGHDEAWQGLPFVGPSGDKLDRWLQKAGIQRHKCFVGNTAQCWMPEDRPPTVAEVKHCRKAYWGPALAALHNLRVVVPIGVPAMQAILGREASAASAGIVSRIRTEDLLQRRGVLDVEGSNHREAGVRNVQTQEPTSDNSSPDSLRNVGRPDTERLDDRPPVRQHGVREPASPGSSNDEREHSPQPQNTGREERSQDPLSLGTQLRGSRETPKRQEILHGVQATEIYVVPILHPAFIMRGAWAQEPVQVAYLKRVKEIAETGEWHAQSVTEAPPGTLLYPTKDDIIEWDEELRVDAWPPGHCQGVTVDIEAAGPHITIIGLCRIKDLVPIVLRFRSCGGEVYDNFPSVLKWKVEWLDRLLRDPLIPKVFHNGQAYDICQLWRTGFEVVNYSFDTMLGMHIAYPELPKALEFVSNVFAGIGGWKKLAKVDPEGEGK